MFERIEFVTCKLSTAAVGISQPQFHKERAGIDCDGGQAEEELNPEVIRITRRLFV